MQDDLEQKSCDHEGNEELVTPVDQKYHGILLEIRLIMRNPAIREIFRGSRMAFLAALSKILLDDCRLFRFHLHDVMHSMAINADGNLFFALPILFIEFHGHAMEILQIGFDDSC